MKYNRAEIIRNEESLPLLKAVDSYEDEDMRNSGWLFESKETFHGEHDDEYFYFMDARIDSRLKLPLNCVILEFEDENNALQKYMEEE